MTLINYEKLLLYVPNNSVDWNLIAEHLQNAWEDSVKMPIKGRSCKEHLDVLLAHHKAGNTAALNK